MPPPPSDPPFDAPPLSARTPQFARAVDRTLLVLAALFVLGAFGVVAARLRYGVDFTDEAFYVTLPYRFALGAVPFRDEQNLSLFAGLFGLPFVKALLWIHGGTDSLILGMRHVHLLFTAGVAVAVFVAARRWVGAASAAVTAAGCIAFTPFTLHQLSYNTLACGFLTIAFFLAARARASRGSAGAWFWVGLLLALASVAYPTLAVGALAFMAINFWPAAAEPGRRRLTLFIVGGCVVALAVLALALAVGLDNVLAVRTYLAAFRAQGGGWPKVLRIGHEFIVRTPFLGTLMVAGVVYLVMARRTPGLLGPAMLVVPAVFWHLLDLANGTLTLYLVTGVACLAPWLTLAAGPRPTVAPLMRAVWWPSILCGAITGWSSSNGATNASIGTFPAALCSLLLLQMAWQRHAGGSVFGAVLARLAALGTPALFVAVLIAGDYRDYYGDPVQRRAMTSRIEWGPYKGIATTPARARQLDEFRRVVLPQLRHGDRSIVFDAFPAGYLLLGLPPASNSVWLPPAAPGEDRSLTVAYWTSRQAPTVAFVTPKAARSGDPLLQILDNWGFQPVAATELGTLLRRTP